MIIRPCTMDQLQRALELIGDAPYVVLGSGSNVLVDSAGIRCPVLILDGEFHRIRSTGEGLVVGGAAWVPGVALAAANAGFAGIEHIVGIPGTFGGLVRMNGGSMRRAIGEAVDSVVLLTRDGLVHMDATALDFGYRYSAIQEGNDIVCEVRLRFDTRDGRGDIRRRMRGILRQRRHKFPRKVPSCGSVFMADAAVFDTLGPPGKIIERLGLKGAHYGGALISPLHANFFVNAGGCTSEQMLATIWAVREHVAEKTGHSMRSEALYLDSNGRIVPVTTVVDRTVPALGCDAMADLMRWMNDCARS